MNRQLITLIGVLVTGAVVALGVALGVLPLVGNGIGALGQTAQAESVNAGYQTKIDSLTAEKKKLPETEASVAALRDQIPAQPLVDQAFALIDRSASDAGVEIASITRGELAEFTPRPAPTRSGLVMEAQAGKAPASAAAPSPQATPPTTPAPAEPTAAPADADGAQPAKSADAAAARQQVPITVSAKAPTMDAVQAFLDGLRGDGRLLAIDKATVTVATGSFDVQVEALTFVQTEGSGR